MSERSHRLCHAKESKTITETGGPAPFVVGTRHGEVRLSLLSTRRQTRRTILVPPAAARRLADALVDAADADMEPDDGETFVSVGAVATEVSVRLYDGYLELTTPCRYTSGTRLVRVGSNAHTIAEDLRWAAAVVTDDGSSGDHVGTAATGRS